MDGPVIRPVFYRMELIQTITIRAIDAGRRISDLRRTSVKITPGRVPAPTRFAVLAHSDWTNNRSNEQKEAQEVLKNSKKDLQEAWQLTRDIFDMNTDPMAKKGNLIGCAGGRKNGSSTERRLRTSYLPTCWT